MLEKLVQRNKDWQNLAYRICGNYDHAQDLVQEMYIKLSNYERVNEALVAITIKNLWLDLLKKKKREVSIERFYSLPDNNKIFELDDEQNIYLQRFNNLSMTQQELILESFDKSTRQIGREFNINYCYVHRQIHKGLKKILKEDYKKYKNSNLKYLKKCKNESN